MSPHRLFSVLTTIQEPTACVQRLAECLRKSGATLIVMGDSKGPFRFPLEHTQFFPLEDQGRLPYALASLLPTGHYVRKNLGYLEAFRQSADCIYETDDDNRPAPNWMIRRQTALAQKAVPRGWLNIYRLFSDQLIWPRGFPLELINDPKTFEHDDTAPALKFNCPIQQGLADLAPDVDAIWRLTLAQEIHFRDGPSIWLPPGTWCPFNSQSTWWWPAAYPLMYLPSYCSFRMTDIWRSFIAQRCLWELGHGMVFHAAEVVQERNVHNLLRDFQDEVPGYLNNRKIVSVLAALFLHPGRDAVTENLVACYEALVSAGYLDLRELDLVRAWCQDCASCCQ